MYRRMLIKYAAGTVAAAATGALVEGVAQADPGVDPERDPAHPAGPQANKARPESGGAPAVTPNDIRFEPRVLRRGHPAEVGMLPDRVEKIRTDMAAYLQPTADHPTWPTYAGATVLAAKDGVVVLRAATGKAVRYSAVGPPPTRTGVELPPDQQIAATTETMYDMASVSKLFTTVTLMQLVEAGPKAGGVSLDATVASYIPEFAAGGKETVTVRHLLTHSSGLPAFRPLYSEFPTPEARINGALTTPVTAGSSPGNQYVYSDLGLITLGVLIERKTGLKLEAAIHRAVIDPLGLKDTGYNPGPDKKHRIAATEDESYVGRGVVWGEVHDENAWSLGGVAGHAGLFSTVDDLAVYCQMLLNGGEYKGRRILRQDTIRSMLVNYNAHLEATYPDSDRGLGFELNKHWYMGGLASPVTFGHTGFTGTSLVIDPLSHTFLIFLSNRVHPDRNWGTNTVTRRALGTDLADAIPVRPLLGGTAWRADFRNGGTVTLTAPLRAPIKGTGLGTFLLWYDTEPHYDTAYVDASLDGGTTWASLPVTLRPPVSLRDTWTAPDGAFNGYGGRRWWRATVALPAGATHLRWRYTTDASSQGRGVYVDQVTALDNGRPVFNGEGADAGRFTADGWTRSAV
jgi:CubicO group peptidase (beta-lactamase class C family)